MSEEEPNKVAKLASVLKFGVGLPMMAPGSGPAPWKKKQQQQAEESSEQTHDVDVSAPSEEVTPITLVPTPSSRVGPPALPPSFLQRVASEVPEQTDVVPEVSESTPMAGDEEQQQMVHFKRTAAPKRAAASRKKAIAFETFEAAEPPTASDDNVPATEPEVEQETPSTMDSISLKFSHTVETDTLDSVCPPMVSTPASSVKTPSNARPPLLPTHITSPPSLPSSTSFPPALPSAATGPPALPASITSPASLPPALPPTIGSIPPPTLPPSFAPAPPSMPPPEDLPSFSTLRRRSSSRKASLADAYDGPAAGYAAVGYMSGGQASMSYVAADVTTSRQATLNPEDGTQTTTAVATTPAAASAPSSTPVHPPVPASGSASTPVPLLDTAATAQPTLSSHVVSSAPTTSLQSSTTPQAVLASSPGAPSTEELPTAFFTATRTTPSASIIADAFRHLPYSSRDQHTITAIAPPASGTASVSGAASTPSLASTPSSSVAAFTAASSPVDASHVHSHSLSASAHSASGLLASTSSSAVQPPPLRASPPALPAHALTPTHDTAGAGSTGVSVGGAGMPATRPPPLPLSTSSYTSAAASPPATPASSLTGPPPFPSSTASSVSRPLLPSTPSSPSNSHHTHHAAAGAATPVSTTSAASMRPDAGASMGDANMLRTLHLQVAAARAALGKTQETLPPVILPSFFPPDPITLPPAQRSNEQVFLCGPIGYSSDPVKKGWKCMWGVLFRDRLELYQRFGDSKPKITTPLEAALITSADDIASPARATISIVRSKADPVYLRAEKPIAATNANVPVAKADIPIPDPATTHRAWFHSLRFRSENAEYVARCRSSRSEPDERVLRAYDAQIRTAAAHHVNMTYCPDHLLRSLVSVPMGYLAPAPADLFTPAPLAVEGIVLDLSTTTWSQEAATALSRLLSDPEAVPVLAVRSGSLPMALPVAELIFTALCSNALSGLVEIDVSSAPWLSARDAPALVAKFFTSPCLKRLTTLTMRGSDLTGEFLSNVCNAINTSSTTQGGYGCLSSLRVLDLAQNMLNDAAITMFMGVCTQSLSLSASLTTLILSHNPIGDDGARAIAAWITAPRPTTGYTGPPIQRTHAPYRSIALQHLLLRGTLIADAGCSALCAALAWSTTVRTLDLANSHRISHEGAAALSHLAQINESLDTLRFLNYKLTTQGLNAMRLMYRFERGDPALFDAEVNTGKKHFTRAMLVSEYPPQ